MVKTPEIEMGGKSTPNARQNAREDSLESKASLESIAGKGSPSILFWVGCMLIVIAVLIAGYFLAA